MQWPSAAGTVTVVWYLPSASRATLETTRGLPDTVQVTLPLSRAALGVALLGTVFFGYLGGGHSFEAALVHTAPYAMGAFALCGILSMLLPPTAVSERALTES